MTPLLMQLYAMRAQLEATIAAFEAAVVDADLGPVPAPSEVCQHPPERQRNASTFGEPATIVCMDCGLTRPGSVS